MIKIIEPYEEFYEKEYFFKFWKEMDLAYKINKIQLDMKKVSVSDATKTATDDIEQDNYQPKLGKFKAYRKGIELQDLKTFDNYKSQEKIKKNLEQNSINKINYDKDTGNYYHSGSLGLYSTEKNNSKSKQLNKQST